LKLTVQAPKALRANPAMKVPQHCLTNQRSSHNKQASNGGGFRRQMVRCTCWLPTGSGMKRNARVLRYKMPCGEGRLRALNVEQESNCT